MPIARTEPYMLGYMSYCTGMPKINNPYPTDSQEHKEWLEGWEAAREESEASKSE